MSLTVNNLPFWICIAFLLTLMNLGLTNTSPNTGNNTTDNKSIQRTPSRRLPMPWRKAKLPVRPPRLQKLQRTTTTASTVTVIPSSSSSTELMTITEKPLYVPKDVRQDTSFGAKRRIDIIEPSSSDNQRSVVWPVRQRPVLAAKRFRAPTPTTPTPQLLLKLLQPKPTRPAIYSLDGFVPKPSLKKISSTTEPPFLYGRNDLQLLPSVVRRRKVNRYSKEGDDEDYQDDELVKKKKPVSRYTAFARKGVPGEDFPVYSFIPLTDFECREQPGLYADPYTNCQVWHMCPGGNLAPRHSFLCPNGTIFNQKKRICDWWYNVGCRKHRNLRSAMLLDFNDQQDFDAEPLLD